MRMDVWPSGTNEPPNLPSHHLGAAPAAPNSAALSGSIPKAPGSAGGYLLSGGGLQSGAPGQFSEWGTLDRRELAKRNIKTVLAENPVVIGHAFTTGRITRR